MIPPRNWTAAGPFADSGVFFEGWSGPAGLNWSLGAGNYWVAFEVRAGDTLTRDGMAATMIGFAPSPLGDEAGWSPQNQWLPVQFDNLDIGVRIFGDPSGQTPEPPTALLAGLGLAMFAVSRRRRVLAAG